MSKTTFELVPNARLYIARAYTRTTHAMECSGIYLTWVYVYCFHIHQYIPWWVKWKWFLLKYTKTYAVYFTICHSSSPTRKSWSFWVKRNTLQRAKQEKACVWLFIITLHLLCTFRVPLLILTEGKWSWSPLRAWKVVIKFCIRLSLATCQLTFNKQSSFHSTSRQNGGFLLENIRCISAFKLSKRYEISPS